MRRRLGGECLADGGGHCVHGLMEGLPSGALGVPTAMNEMSVAAIAAAVLSVAVSRFCATALAVRSPISASTIGETASPEHVDFLGADVDADDLVAEFGEAGAGNRHRHNRSQTLKCA